MLSISYYFARINLILNYFTPDDLLAYAENTRFTPAERIYLGYAHPCRALASPLPSCKPPLVSPQLAQSYLAVLLSA